MTPAHILIDQVLARVRDPEGVTATRDFVRRMLSASQQLVNAKLNFVLDEQSLVTEPLRCFYPITALAAQSQKVLYVRDGTRDLVYAPWRTFWYMKRGWPREIGERHELWSIVGRELLVAWPTRRVSVTLTVVSAASTVPLANEQSLFGLPDDALPMVVDLAEVLTLLRMRNVGPASEAIDQLTARMRERGMTT